MVSNTAWIALEQVLRLTSALFVGIWIARYLGPADYGLISYVVSLISVFLILSKFGLDNILIREYLKSSDSWFDVLTFSLKIRFLSSFFVFLLCFIFSIFFEFDYKVFIIASVAVICQFFDVSEFYFLANYKAKFLALIKLLQLLLSVIVKIILILSNAPVDFFLYWLVVESFLLTVLYFLYFLYFEKGLCNKTKIIDKKQVINERKLLYAAIPLMLASVLAVIYTKADIFIIAFYLDDEDVGLYVAALRLAELIILPVFLLNTGLRSLLLADRNDSYEIYAGVSQLYVVCSYVMLVFIYFFGERVILLLFGETYVGAVSPLIWLTISNCFVAGSLAFSSYFVKFEKTGVMLWVTGLSLLINLIFNFILVPRFGISGAAYSSFFARLFSALILFFFDRKIFTLQLMSLFLVNLKYLRKIE